MSELAHRERSARQRWAQPGSRHDRLVRFAGVALPVAIGVLAAFLVMAPLTSAGDVSFVLDKNKVDVAQERLKIQAAEYRGSDAKGQPFRLHAGSAIQRSSAEPVVQLRALSASLRLPEGPASLVAGQGRYDMDAEQVAVDGPIRFRAADGYAINTSDATVDLKARSMKSAGNVTGSVPRGTFSADRLQADLESRTVVLEGHARLRIIPKGPR